jgi:2',3'-cyclic-nucleotide 2'-phosphodiesterase (5'-nucleotidase family)
VNDLHSNYQLDPSGVSAYSLLKGYYLETKKQNPFTLFTSGGDEYEKGAVAEQISQGLSTREILHGLNFDVRVIGNHDFGWSEEEVLQDSRDPYSQVLASNIQYTGNDPLGFGAKDYVELQVGCVKIGFFGLVSGPWNDQDQYAPGNFYPDMPTNLDYTTVAQGIVSAHRKDVDLLIGVTHIGASADAALALAVPGIDAILGGHSHTLIGSLNDFSTPNTWIIQSGAFAGFVDRLDLTYDLKQKKLVGTPQYTVTPLIDGLPVDAATQQLVTSVLKKDAPGAQTPVGTMQAATPDYGHVASVAMKAALAQIPADAAVIDLGTVWNNLPAGPVSAQDFLNAFKVEREPPGTPGFNSFYQVQISGSALQTLQANADSGWAVMAPPNIDASKTYVLAVQKRTAFHPTVYLPAGVTFLTAPLPVDEVWSVLNSYALARQKACQYMDVDQPMIPGCTPAG